MPSALNTLVIELCSRFPEARSEINACCACLAGAGYQKFPEIFAFLHDRFPEARHAMARGALTFISTLNVATDAGHKRVFCGAYDELVSTGSSREEFAILARSLSDYRVRR